MNSLLKIFKVVIVYHKLSCHGTRITLRACLLSAVEGKCGRGEAKKKLIHLSSATAFTWSGNQKLQLTKSSKIKSDRQKISFRFISVFW